MLACYQRIPYANTTAGLLLLRKGGWRPSGNVAVNIVEPIAV